MKEKTHINDPMHKLKMELKLDEEKEYKVVGIDLSVSRISKKYPSCS